jgi:hypothetical protein
MKWKKITEANGATGWNPMETGSYLRLFDIVELRADFLVEQSVFCGHEGLTLLLYNRCADLDNVASVPERKFVEELPAREDGLDF